VLPQGASTSPVISNIILRKLDSRLSKMASSRGIQYSRYADDMTFSGERKNFPPITLLREVIREEGFLLHPQKIGFHKKGRRQLVTSLTVSNGVHVDRSFKKKVAKHIYCCITFGVENHLKYLGIPEQGFYREWLLGKIYYIYSIERETAHKLLKEFNKIDWPS